MAAVVVPFKVEHLSGFIPQKMQAREFDIFGADCYKAAEEGFSFSLLVDEKCVACAGISEIWASRGHAWALISADAGKHFILVTRAVKRAISVSGFDRIEMDVSCDFPEAHRWAKLLGFTCEVARREKFLPDGTAMALYARVD
jgi:hypothetical protein